MLSENTKRLSKEGWLVALLLCVGLLSIALASPKAFAEEDYIHPKDVQVSTPVYQADLNDFDPPLGAYDYRVSWEGIGAARIRFNVERKGNYFYLSTEAKTNSFVDLFYKMRYNARGVIGGSDLHPFKAVIDQRENSRIKRTELSFFPNGSIHSLKLRKGRDTEEFRFKPKNFMLDPFSAAFLARSQSWEKGQVREFDTFNGTTRYLIRLEAVDEEMLEVNGEQKKVWVVSPSVKKLTSTNPKQKLKSAKIYITADKSRDILKIVSSVFVGNVYTELEQFTPFEPATDQRVAKLSTPRKIILK